MEQLENLKSIVDKGTKWIDIVNPNPENIKFLQETYGFHELDLEDLQDRKIQRSKIDEYENYLFIVLHIPVYHKGRDRLIAVQMDIFIGQDFLITIHTSYLKKVEEIFQECKKNLKQRRDYVGKGTGYLLYEVLSALFDSCFPLIEELEDEINDMEKEVFRYERQQKDMLKDILLMKKDLITFNRIIFPQRTVMAQLEHKHKKFLAPELDVYFDDVVDKVEKLSNSLENLQEMVATLKDINESVISHNTNKIIKTLTVFSVIMLPLTLISGIYGMNLEVLPYSHDENSFFIVLSMMLLIAVTMLIYFKFRKWI